MPEDTYQDIRQRLFEAAWDAPAYPPASDRTVARARRRAATTIGGGALAIVLAIVVAAAALPFDTTDRNVGVVPQGDDRVYLVNTSTGKSTEITNLTALERARWIDVSPDGERIAYTSDRSGSPQVYVANLDGSGVRQLTRRFVDAYQPDWSPSGDRLVFGGLRRGDVTRNLYMVDVASGRTRRLTREAKDALAPEWSADGRSVLYFRVIQGPEITGDTGDTAAPGLPSYQIRSIDTRTRTIELIFGSSKAGGIDPTWTEAGILFMRERGITYHKEGEMDLALLPHGDRRARSLLRIPSFGWGPQLSPDGRTVAFERDVPGHEQVYLYDIQTGRLRSLRPGVQASWVDADTLLVQERALDWNPEEESSA